MNKQFGEDFLSDMGSFWNRRIDKKESILEDIPVNTRIKKTVMPLFEIVYIEDTGFGVFSCEDEEEGSINISGEFASKPIEGQTYRVEGKVVVYRGEKQLRVEKIWNVKPATKKGIIAYLKTLKGLKSRAELIYREFGNDSIRVLMENPTLVSKRVAGIGKKSVMAWKEQLEKLSESQEIISTLLGWGITPKEAKKLYDTYKDDVISKIESNPYFLATEVKGYGFEKCDRIAKEVGISPRSPFRIQEGIIHSLKSSTLSGHCYLPYDELVSLCSGFLTVRLSYQEMRMFMKEYSGRTEFEYSWGSNGGSAQMSMLSAEESNVFTIDYNRMVKALNDYENETAYDKKDEHRYIVCSITPEEISRELQSVNNQSRVVCEDNRIYLKNLYFDEVAVTKQIIRLAEKKPSFTRAQVEAVLDEVLSEKKIILEEKQRKVCIDYNLCTGGFAVICGSAGTGKTFVLLIVLEVKRRLYRRYFKRELIEKIKILAPTGKASKVASKATGMECMTIHRGLGVVPGLGFQHNLEEPLPYDVVVVDESSMLDISLSRSLFEAIALGTQVILMGDIKQLPSVGPGSVLMDIMTSGVVDVIELDVIKRQGLLSGINRNAINIINGEMVQTYNDSGDAYIVNRETISGCQKGIVDSIKRILTFEGFSHDEIQVLAPQRTGSMGTYMLNYILQREFNPGNEENKVLYTKFQAKIDESSYNPEEYSLYFKTGDKVIHVKNNYDCTLYSKGLYGGFIEIPDRTGITNGECGIIESIEKVQGEGKGETKYRIIVKYEDYYVIYSDGFEELELAWALTIHKSQGSAWKAIVVPMMTSYWNMLDRTLFYTAITRAVKFLAIVGSKRAMKVAIDTQKATKRHTYLKDRLVELKNIA